MKDKIGQAPKAGQVVLINNYSGMFNPESKQGPLAKRKTIIGRVHILTSDAKTTPHGTWITISVDNIPAKLHVTDYELQRETIDSRVASNLKRAQALIKDAFQLLQGSTH